MANIPTFGRFPTLGEMKAYYHRDDVLSFLYEESKLRTLRAAFRAKSWDIFPTSKDHLRQIIGETVEKRIEKAYNNPPDSVRLKKLDYLSFHWCKRLTEGEKLKAFDLFFELDLHGWRRSFEGLSGVIRLLDDLEVCYRMKYSGVRSLHLIIPFEALPKQFNGEPILNQHAEISKKVVAYFRQHCGMKNSCKTQYLRMAYSLNEDNGLVSLPLTSEGLPHFRPWQAQLYNVSVDQPWHAEVPKDAWRKTLRLLQMATQNAKPKKQVSYGLPIVLPKKQHVLGCEPTVLAAQLRSTDEAARVEAAWHLMTTNHPIETETLKAAFSDENPDVRWYLTEALAQQPTTASAEMAARMLSDADQFVRISAGDVLVRAGMDDPDDILKILLEAVELSDWAFDAMYIVEKQIYHIISKNQLEVAGDRIAQVFEALIEGTSGSGYVRKWMRQVREMCQSKRALLAPLLRGTIELCLEKLSENTDAAEIRRRAHMQLLLDCGKSNAMPIAILQEIAEVHSVDLSQVVSSRRAQRDVAWLRAFVKPLLEAFSQEDHLRLLCRFLLLGSNRNVAATLLAQLTTAEHLKQVITPIVRNIWEGYVADLKKKAGALERALTEEIERRASVIAALDRVDTLDAIIDALRNVREEMDALQITARALGRQQRHFKPGTPAPAWMQKAEIGAIPALIEAIKDKDEALRHHAIAALAKIGGPAVIPPLVEALADPQKGVRFQAVSAVCQIGKPAVPALIEAVRKQNGRQSAHAIIALGRIGDATAVPVFSEALSEPGLVFNASKALGEIGGTTAVPALIELLKHKRPEIRKNAVAALAKINTPEAVSALKAFQANAGDS